MLDLYSKKDSHDDGTSDFKVIWSNVYYRVQPSVSFSEACEDVRKSAQGQVNFLLKSHKRGSYNLQPRNQKKESVTILRNASGSFRSGELTAVMGPSGAGKTTLLNFIARRKEKGYTGSLRIEGLDHRLRISTIPQDDYLPPYLSVRENLLFASKLRNLRKGFDHKKMVNQVVVALNLEKCVDTKIKKISGGQQKRVSIAQELISRPDILILDEPTSGLDTVTCHKILQVLRRLVEDPLEKPIAILLTIHQPEHNVFDIFDRVYALAPGGIAIYDGPPKECASYIKKYTGLKLPHPDYNPASFIIEIASGEYGQQPIDTLMQQVESDELNRKRIFTINGTKQSTSNVWQKIHNAPSESYTTDRENLDIDNNLVIGSSLESTHFWTRTAILSRRYLYSQIRDPLQMLACVAAHTLLPLCLLIITTPDAGRINGCPRMIGQISLYDMANSENLISEGLLNELELCLENVGTFFCATFSIMAMNSAIATLSFSLDMLSSLKEYHNGWYSITSYLLARILTDIPASVVMPTICITLLFYLTGQDPGGSFTMTERALLASISTSLGAIAGRLVGMIFGAIFMGKVITALFTSQAAYMPLMLFCGFLVRWRHMKPISRLLSQFSFLKHNLELNMLARYGFKVCPCQPDSIKETTISGVSEDLRRFTQYYFNQANDEGESNNLTANIAQETSGSDDIFQLFADQVSLFNTFGRKILTCDQMIPQPLYQLSVTDQEFVPTLVKYSLLVLGTVFLLFFVVKLVVRSKTSL